MNLSQRKRHFLTWLVLAVLLLGGLVYAAFLIL